MKIAIDILPGLGAGVGRWQRETVRVLANDVRDHQVSVFAYEKRYSRPNWMPSVAKYRRSWFPGQAQRFLMNRLHIPIEVICGLGRPDVVLSLCLHPLVARAPVVLGVADVSWRYFGDQYRTTFNSLQIKLAEDAILRADHLLTLSQSSADDLIRGGVPASKVTVAYLGVGKDFVDVCDADADRVRKAYELPDEFILYVGGINERKNVTVLTTALERLRPSPPLIIIGPEPAEPLSYWKLDRSWVRYLGYVPDTDVPGILRAATVLVFPSKLEGFGLPLVEAMAAGTPVIASEIPVFREIGGNAVLFFPPDDFTKLAELIREVLDSQPLRAEYRSRGLSQVAGHTWNAYGSKLLTALRVVSRT